MSLYLFYPKSFFLISPYLLTIKSRDSPPILEQKPNNKFPFIFSMVSVHSIPTIEFR